MNEIPTDTQPASIRVRLGRWALRVAGASAALGLVGLIATASTLEPASSGLGTHHQLGLPPCSIRVLFGIRCPSCGMTTSWAHLTRGEFASAAQVNTGGALLFVYSLFCIGSTIQLAVTARIPGDRVIRNYTLALIAIALVTLVDWGVRLAG